jgi:hypothetical protein
MANLDGAQEVPPVNTPAFGHAMGLYDDATNTVTIQMFMVDDLLAPMTASHFHQAPFGVNGPVIVNLPSFGTWSGGPSDYVYTQTSPIVLTDPQEAAFMANGVYLNIHTQQFPGGEIRGQVMVVPEPVTLLSLAAGAGLLAIRRRKRA